jgi:hypothetical protein
MSKFLENVRKLGLGDAVLAKFSKETGEDRSTTIKAGFGGNINITQNIYGVGYSDIKDTGAKQLFKDEIAGYVINEPDLLRQDASILSLTDEQKRTLKDYKGAISGECLSAIRVSFAIINSEDSGNWKDASKLNEKFEYKFRMLGKKIYNLTRSGFIDGLILTELRWMIYEYQGSKSYQDIFKKKFDAYLEFFPHAVYTNEMTSRKELHSEIMKRLRISSLKCMELYSRGESNNYKLESVVKIIVDSGSGSIEQKEQYIITEQIKRTIKKGTRRKKK